MKTEITGIVLAGGKSSRMGYDKGLMIVDGKRMIERVVETLLKVLDTVIIVSNTDSYDYLDLPVYKDELKEKGPLGGIYTGLFHSTTQKNIIVACDMPFITEELLSSFILHAEGKQIVVPSVNGNIEPLCGYYDKGIMEQLKKHIESDMLAVHKAITTFDHMVLAMKDTDIALKNVFKNINRPEDLG